MAAGAGPSGARRLLPLTLRRVDLSDELLEVLVRYGERAEEVSRHLDLLLVTPRRPGAESKCCLPTCGPLRPLRLDQVLLSGGAEVPSVWA